MTVDTLAAPGAGRSNPRLPGTDDRHPSSGGRTARHHDSAAAGSRRGRYHRQTLGLRLARLHRLDDRAVHPVGHLVREIDAHVLEANSLQPGDVFGLRERAGDAADVGAALRPVVRAQPVLGDDVAIPTRPPGLSTRAISASTAGFSTASRFNEK